MTHIESDEQIALMDWVKLQTGKYPELELIYHVPNGGSRKIREAARLKREGVKAGVPDLVLPVARGGCHGLYIELKTGKNKPTDAQKWWHERLKKQGYAIAVAYGWFEASEYILDYLNSGQDIHPLMRQI